MRETVGTKAARLLVAGSVTVLEVDASHVLARVVGDHGIYTVEHDRRWSCDCPSLSYCSHAIAVARVVVVNRAAGTWIEIAGSMVG
jgi:hypothetical protein